jgi:hypothetical protein
MSRDRFFGTVALHCGALVVHRDDDGPDAFLSAARQRKPVSSSMPAIEWNFLWRPAPRLST